jgi:hypothetical protein
MNALGFRVVTATALLGLLLVAAIYYGVINP